MAVPASRQTLSQVGLFFENRADSPIILSDDTADFFFAVPVRNKLEMRVQLCYKKAKCSLMSLMYLGMPSLLLLFFLGRKIRIQRGLFFCKAEIQPLRWETTDKRVSQFN